MGLHLVTAPVVEPTNATNVKLHCRITDNAQDDRITAFIASARAYCENRLGRQLINATWRLTLDRFPGQFDTRDNLAELWSHATYRVPAILVPRPPLYSVTKIEYLDTTGSLVEWAADQYQVDADSEPGRIALAPGASWPAIGTGYLNPVRVTFVAGYGTDSSKVPADIRHAIEMLAAHFYENREATNEVSGKMQQTEIALGISDLLDLHRVDQYVYPD